MALVRGVDGAVVAALGHRAYGLALRKPQALAVQLEQQRPGRVRKPGRAGVHRQGSVQFGARKAGHARVLAVLVVRLVLHNRIASVISTHKAVKARTDRRGNAPPGRRGTAPFAIDAPGRRG